MIASLTLAGYACEYVENMKIHFESAKDVASKYYWVLSVVYAQDHLAALTRYTKNSTAEHKRMDEYASKAISDMWAHGFSLNMMATIIGKMLHAIAETDANSSGHVMPRIKIRKEAA